MATVNVRFSLLNRGTNNFSKETITVRTIRSVDSLVDANANFDLQPLACPAGEEMFTVCVLIRVKMVTFCRHGVANGIRRVHV